ncbi:SDR family oxidoreductase [Fodinicola acaciae]|uniref:SDR family oxidoreductase n=1 Tax=Fodinicola acaciae TaxID=2681555 RepID=UPI001C9E6F40|nr:SDR family oxidoreductase [Fodinicola acaciae]
MKRSVLVTGPDGVVGSEVMARLAIRPDLDCYTVSRRRPGPRRIGWHIGREPMPEQLRRHWDVVVHLAASTRWTMTKSEAEQANIAPIAAMLDLVDERTHLVHVSTAYVGGYRTDDDLVSDEFGGFRNGYEWSKAQGEELVRTRHAGQLTVIRPPLILGRRDDGGISRFSGPYSLLQALVSGLAAVVVGDPGGYAEIAPVDQVAEAVVAAVDGNCRQQIEVVAGGTASLRLDDLLTLSLETLNDWRVAHGVPPLERPPIVSTERWHRFFLPLAEQHLSEVQHRAVQLLGMFESYTSMMEPFEPTNQVVDPAEVLRRSVRWWADSKPRLAARLPEPWALVAA